MLFKVLKRETVQKNVKELKLEAIRRKEVFGKPASEVVRELGPRRKPFYKWKEQLKIKRAGRNTRHISTVWPEAVLMNLKEKNETLKNSGVFLLKDWVDISVC